MRTNQNVNSKKRRRRSLIAQNLEKRQLLAGDMGAAPSFEPVEPQTVLIGSPLHVPIDASDADGGPLTVSVDVADDDLLEAVVISGNRSLRVDVEGFGEMIFELFEQRAPTASQRVIELADAGFYDGILFHRIVDGFVIQGGDPTGTGVSGSSLPNFSDDFHPDLQHNRRGVLSFAKSSDDTNNSQFFVTEIPTRFLDFNHSVFGQLIEGEAVREAISNVEVLPRNSRPVDPVVMSNVEVFDDIENSLIMFKSKNGMTGSTSVVITVTDAEGNSSSETVSVSVGEDTANSQPFLQPLDLPRFSSSVPAVVQLMTTDIEGDPVRFATGIDGPAGATAEVDQNGLLTVTAPLGFEGTIEVIVGVGPGIGVVGNSTNDSDTEVLQFDFFSASLDLLAASDSGLSDSDNITNNSSLVFVTEGAIDGVEVELLVDGEVVGSELAAGSAATITTTRLSELGDGVYDVSARQLQNGTLTDLGLIQVEYDSTAPKELRPAIDQHVVAGETYRLDLQSEEEGNGVRYSLSSAPDFAGIDPNTGLIEWTPINFQIGTHSFVIVVTDAAGNARAESFSVDVAEGPIVEIRLELTDLLGNPITTAAIGESVLLKMVAYDLRSIGSRQGVFSAYTDIAFDESLVRADSIEFHEDFTVVESGAISGSRIDELGAVSNLLQAHGQRESVIATVTFTALADGQNIFGSQPATEDVLVFGYDDRVKPEQIVYGSTALTVGGTPYHRADQPHDVNGDGKVSALDALVIMNALNRNGGSIDPDSSDPSLLEPGYLYNVVADSRISSLDILAVINQLSRLEATTPDAESMESLPVSDHSDDQSWELSADQVMVDIDGLLF